ncbi:flavodoxin [Fulvivirgaceae bacterium PWU4]|uniref:Flavodoxin n=1 Tax=Chryseosolibacter histidini TaxID=2782349 RepID=A0AAP2DHY8_9BACT|nr:flavodoxin [Chryseosolibacter histidini]MBT1695552.1 flavodoxin [Chryseosolibacter histidini]
MKRSEFVKRIFALSLLTTTTGSLFARIIRSKEQTLIVYLSRTNNTKAIAQMIQKELGGDLLLLELAKPYPEDYKKTVDQVSNENETGYLPELPTKVYDIGRYNTIFIGYPTWDMQLPPPMKSFLTNHDLRNKTIVPFNTNAGYGLGTSVETIKKLSKSSKVLEPFKIEGGKERDGILFVMKGEKEKQAQIKIKKWLLELQLIK